jgi:hypothetical protein
MAALYLICLAAVIFGTVYYRHEMVMPLDADSWVLVAYLGLLFGICGVLALVYLSSFFIHPRPWAWIYHLVLICVGLSSPCIMPASIPLLIFWIRPETRQYFGRI